MTKTEDTELPSALRNILIKVRKGLKDAGDDGSGAVSASVPVKFGWREVRAVYALHVALNEARFARDKFKRASRKNAKALEAARKGGLDRETRRLLKDVEMCLSGEETSASALHGVLLSVRETLRTK